MMKGFLLVVNILALTLPFLAAEIQNQQQTTCHENDERSFCRKAVPKHVVLNSYPPFGGNYYQHRPFITVHNPYLSQTKPVAVRPHAQIPQWPVRSGVYPSPGLRPTYLRPSYVIIPPQIFQDKAPVPTINTIAVAEPTAIPSTEPTVNAAIPSEASSGFIITSTPEATAIPATSPVV
ncbi:kappa-casein [Dasypus novemcinctus]|uniref:kappa-casein n=1 Tax=Dasypus novemcinctus TaxID=9361 RepID=UPI00265EB694|nr:kappa-casein [Dasypus novemcinctus]